VSERLRHIPNVITSLRILLVIPIAITLLHGRIITTLALFIVAGATDLADGFLAKRFGWQSAVGSVLDPAADKLLSVTVLVVLAVLRLVPLWLMAAAVTRDLVIVLGAIAYRVCFGPIEVRPSLISRLNTLCQALYMFSVIGRSRFAVPPASVVVVLGALSFVTIVVSGLDYVLRYGAAAVHEAKSRHASLRADGPKLT
jgi:cardiolipin synthase (CMP-forming)